MQMSEPATQETSTLYSLLRERTATDRLAVIDGEFPYSYADLLTMIQSAASQLDSIGIEPGDRVLIVFPNCVEHIVAVFSVMSLGGTVVPINPEVGEKRLVNIIDNTKPVLVLTHYDTNPPRGSKAVDLRVEPVNKTVQLSPDTATSTLVKRASVTGVDTEAFIRFTSGSTGHPKGVVLTHKHQIWTAQTLAGIFAIDEDHRDLITVSMALSGGWQRVAATLLAGGCIVILKGPLSVQGILEDVQSYKVTGFFTPPPLIRLLLKYSSEKVREALLICRTIEIGSASLTVTELEQFMGLVPHAQVFTHYGLTECSRAVILEACVYTNKLHTAGKPAPGVELAIAGNDNRFLGSDQPGQILLRGPQLFERYYNSTDLNQERFLDGWLATGDYGILDKDGFLTFLGRRDDSIHNGGHSFFPAEAEMELGPVEGVLQYLIAGVQDPRSVLEQVPWAFVIPSNPDTWTPRVFLTQARERLASFMLPRKVIVVPELVMTPSGKPDRRKTVARYAAVEQ